MSNLQVANTILRQLGGHRFKIMTGAKNLIGDENSLTFKVASPICTHVKITLNGLDLYTATGFRHEHYNLNH